MKTEFEISPEGVKLLFVQDDSSPSVSLGIYFGSGSREDAFNKNGTAHLLEHLNFQGTRKRPLHKQLVLEVENNGASFDAFTGKEYTGYEIKSPANKFIDINDILFDMVFDSIFDENEIKREMKVILEEIKMYDDMPNAFIQRIYHKELFPSNNLGIDIAGDEDTLSNISRNDLINFRKDNYTLDNMLISVSGKFDTFEVKKVINELISKVIKKKRNNTILFSDKIEIKNQTINILRPNNQQANIIIGGYAIKKDFNNKNEIQLGNMILSGGMGSLLYQKIREELRLAYYIDTSYSTYKEIGSFQVEMGVDIEKMNIAIDAVLKVLYDFSQGDIDDVDFNRAKNYLIGMTMTQIETASDLATWNALSLLRGITKEFESKSEIIKRIERVTKQDVVKVWKDIIKDNKFLLCNIGPKELVY
jgi:predicted Zn-dependent peptidase